MARLIPKPKIVKKEEGLLRISKGEGVKLVFKGFSKDDKKRIESIFPRYINVKFSEYGKEVVFNPNIEELKGFLDVESFVGNDEMYGLLIDDKVMIYAITFRGVVYALSTLKQLAIETENDIVFERYKIVDWPSFKYRGIVEGFYYDPWSWEDRKDIIRFMSGFKMNAYIYAPKDDPYHREKWRMKYPQELIRKLEELIKLSHKYGIEFIFAISPGLSVRYSSSLDEDTLVEKFLEIAQFGVKSFGIFYDDIPNKLLFKEDVEKYGSLGKAQADFTNRVFRRLIEKLGEDVKMIICPTEYRGVKLSKYFDDLSENLHKDILIMWTGPLVIARKLSFEDSSEVSQRAKGRLVIWDNYPVNDYSRNRLNLGPVKGRDGGLFKVLKGFYFNPMNEAHLSMIPLATGADYLWNPEEYDPYFSWHNAMYQLIGEEYSVFEFFTRQLGESIVWPRKPDEVIEIRKNINDSARVREYFERLISLNNDLFSILPEKMYVELQRYLEKLKLYGEAGLKALNSILADNEFTAFQYVIEMLEIWKKVHNFIEIVGTISRHEEEHWRTYIEERFIDDILYELLENVIQKYGWPMNVPKIYSTMDTLEGYGLFNIFDGLKDTFLGSRRGPKDVDEIDIIFGKSLDISSIYITQDNPRFYGFTRNIALYILADGKWSEVARNKGAIEANIKSNIEGIKIKILDNGFYPIFLKGQYYLNEKPLVFTNFPSNSSVHNFLDERLDTYFEAFNVSSNSWIIMDLGKERKISEIQIYQDPKYPVVFEIYIPAYPLMWIIDESLVEWKKIRKVSSSISKIKTNIKTRFLKIKFLREHERIRIYQILLR